MTTLTFEQIRKRLNYLLTLDELKPKTLQKLRRYAKSKTYKPKTRNYINRKYREHKPNVKYHLKIDYKEVNLRFDAWITAKDGKEKEFEEKTEKFLEETNLDNFGHADIGHEITKMDEGQYYFYCNKFPKLEEKWKAIQL